MDALRGETRTMVFYEAPHKLLATLEDMAAVFGPDRRISLCRELTKLHEEVLRTTLGEAAALYRQTPPKGEFVLVLAGAAPESAPACTLEEAARRAQALMEGGLSRKAARRAAQETGLPKNAIYDATPIIANVALFFCRKLDRAPRIRYNILVRQSLTCFPKPPYLTRIEGPPPKRNVVSSSLAGGASSEIPMTAPFRLTAKTALSWEFRLRDRLAPLDSVPGLVANWVRPAFAVYAMASLEIPMTAPFRLAAKTALSWEFLRFRIRLASLDSDPAWVANLICFAFAADAMTSLEIPRTAPFPPCGEKLRYHGNFFASGTDSLRWTRPRGWLLTWCFMLLPYMRWSV